MILTGKRDGLSKVCVDKILQAKYCLHLVNHRGVSRVKYLVHFLDQSVDAANAVLRSVLLDRSIPEQSLAI